MVATVTATDTVDLDPHNEVTYSIVGGKYLPFHHFDCYYGFMLLGSVDRFTVGEVSGVIRLRVSPTITWDFETDPQSYSLTVRGIDFPGGTPRLRVTLVYD